MGNLIQQFIIRQYFSAFTFSSLDHLVPDFFLPFHLVCNDKGILQPIQVVRSLVKLNWSLGKKPVSKG